MKKSIEKMKKNKDKGSEEVYKEEKHDKKAMKKMKKGKK